MNETRTMTDIIGKDNAQELREEFFELIDNGGDYEDVEELFLDYGLEMDYLFEMC